MTGLREELEYLLEMKSVGTIVMSRSRKVDLVSFYFSFSFSFYFQFIFIFLFLELRVRVKIHEHKKKGIEE